MKLLYFLSLLSAAVSIPASSTSSILEGKDCIGTRRSSGAKTLICLQSLTQKIQTFKTTSILKDETIRLSRAATISKDYTGATCAATALSAVLSLSRCGGIFPSGYHPFGYALTELGERFLGFEGSKESDVGRFLASLKSGRKSKSTLKEQWLEVLRVSKSSQSLRIYRMLDELILFSLKAGFIR
jgi:hypothetical protein